MSKNKIKYQQTKTKQTNKTLEQGLREGRFSPPTENSSHPAADIHAEGPSALPPAQHTGLSWPPRQLSGPCFSDQGVTQFRRLQYLTPTPHFASPSGFAYDSDQLVRILVQKIVFLPLMAGFKYVTTVMSDSLKYLFLGLASPVSPRLPLGCGFQKLS